MANKFSLQQLSRMQLGVYLLTILLIIVFIGPYLYISQYIYLSQDDFCRTNISWNSFLPRLRFWYLNENGRYINAFLSLIPVYDLKIYRSIPVLMIICLLISFRYFIKNLGALFEFKIPGYIKFLITILITIQIFIKLPFIFEFVYWYAGITVYFVSVLLILLFLNSLIVFDFTKRRSLIVISLLIILINGNNEMALLLVNFILGLILIYGLKTKSRKLKSIIIFNAVSWISSLPLLLATSSDVRRSYFPNGGDFIFSMKSSFLSAASFIVKNVIGFPDILLWIALVVLLICTGKRAKNEKIKSIKISPLVLAMFSFFALMSQMFVIYYAVGILEAYGGRIANFIHVIFIVLVLINLINLTAYLIGKWPQIINKKKMLPFALIFIGLYLINNTFDGRNYKQVIYDLSSGSAENYKTEIEKRLISINYTDELNMEFSTIPLPKTITNFDLRTVSYWENDCFIDMVNKKFNKNIKSIIRIE